MRSLRQTAAVACLMAQCCLGWERAATSAETKPAPPVSVKLAAQGEALLPVIIPAKPTERVRRIAGTLAEYLGRITGGKFALEAGEGTSGIVVGRAEDFPALDLSSGFDLTDALHREDYRLSSHAKGVRIIGASEVAVEYAVWDFLYRLGYRQFFPGPDWEIVPASADLAIAVDAREHPSYVSRDIGYGLGSWPDRMRFYADWCMRNRTAVPLAGATPPILAVGHAYLQIVADLKDEFARHPEYLALVGGKRVTEGEVKFCISNPGLRKLVAQYAVDYFIKHPDASSISLEPSDGLGWCECKECQALGSVSDRVATLLNEAAAAIRARHGDKKLIGVYAYAEHAVPPRIRVDPMVVVNVATAMTMGDYTTDELVDGWHQAGARIGVRDYYGVFPWDFDLPGRLRMADLAYIKKSIPHYYERGARFMTAESSDSWGVGGLGYYLTARLLWDVREAARVEELTNDFLDKSFGRARETMAEFYRLIDAGSNPRLSSDLIGRMYRTLDQASKMANDPAVAARIRDLVLYVRYVELYRDYGFIEGKERQSRFEELLRYTYRMRSTGMEHTMAVWRGLPYVDQTVKLPAGVGYEIAEGQDPWKDPNPFTEKEIQSFVTAGIARHRLNDFTPVEFSTNLVPATPLNLPSVPAGDPGLFYRDNSVFYTWAANPPAAIPITVKGGILYQNLGEVKLALVPAGAADKADRTTFPPDQKEHPLELKPRSAGLHRVEVADRSAGMVVTWGAGTPWTIPCASGEFTNLHSRWTMYFYVPKETKVVAGYAESLGELHDADGRKVFTFGDRPDYFSVPVAAGQDGRLWKFVSSLGKRILLTVPPYLARDGRELLLPAEVVKADARK